ncbi:MAG: CDP-alcohol phosphatidyltransferase family protein [Pontiellaceae bacterium]|nr:CDP-alcohol phosphatidyltransferase family protein [Pontiellaceae bacterium]MBN2783723.1 CDP-alcohol phosphatidyltransferase family protein [Pontiellaceae bacterium]
MNNAVNGSVGDRRPIKTRDTQWAHRMAAFLARRGLTPNMISVSGMVSGILAGGLLSLTVQGGRLDRICWILGAGLVQLRLLANMLDGMVAVESGQCSLVGELYNEIPDRVSDTAILIGLGCSSGGNPIAGLIAAGLALFTAYVRAMGKAAGAQNEFCGPMAKPHRMFLVTGVSIFYAVAPVSFQTFAGRGAAEWMLWLITLGCLVTVLRRLTRIARTLRGERDV